MKRGDLAIYRDTFTKVSSAGKLYIDHEYFCHSLEDVSRGEGVKIMSETCLATGKYMVILTMSSKFKRIMPMIFTELNGYECKMKGIGFKGARLHGGNTHKDSAGCPLIAFNRLDDNKIQGTAEKSLTEALMRLGLREQKIPLSKGCFDYVELNIYNHARI